MMNALEQAAVRAHRIYPRSKGFRSVYMKGARAALANKAIDDCPYPSDPLKTWRRAYRLAWLGGFNSIRGEGGEEIG